MSIAVRTYDPKQVKTIFGATPMSGFPEGTFVKISRNGPAFEKSKGADGSVDRVNKNANDFTVTLTLKQTSPVNAILSGLLVADILTNSGILPLTIKDLSGTTLFHAPEAWISKDPEAEFSDGLSNREWTFETGPGAFLCGGNN